MSGKTIKQIILSVTVTVLATSVIFASSPILKVYLDNREVPVKTVTYNGEIYVNLTDLADCFPARFNVNLTLNRLDIFSTPPAQDNLAQGLTPQGSGISGEVMLNSGDGAEFPVKNADVYLFAVNPDVPDGMIVPAVNKWLTGSDDSFIKTNGAVRQTKTNQSGMFYMTPPPGDYNLVVVYYTVAGKSGRFWREKVTLKKDECVKVRLNTSSCYNLQ